MYQNGRKTDKPKPMKFWVEEPLNLGIVGGKDVNIFIKFVLTYFLLYFLLFKY